MLVMTRRIGEVTQLTGGIEVTVLDIRGRQVRLGWIAPAAIQIHRRANDRGATPSAPQARRIAR